MAAINLGTVTNGTISQAYNGQFKILRVTDSKIILFANRGFGTGSDCGISYKTSNNNGVTWDENWTHVIGKDEYSNDISYFCVYIDSSSKHIYLVFVDYSTGYPQFLKMSYTGSTWTVGSSSTVSSTSVSKPNILRESNGNLWIAAQIGGGGQYYYGWYSSNDGSSWTELSSNIGALCGECVVLPVGSEIWYFFGINYTGTLEYRKWTESGSSGGGSLGLVNHNCDNWSIGAGKVSDSEIYVSCSYTNGSEGGIKVWKWNGSTWDSGTLLTNWGQPYRGDDNGSISIIDGRPWLVWQDKTGDGGWADVAYRAWDGSSWEAQINLTSDSTNDDVITVMQEDDLALYVSWTRGSSPWNIYFERVALHTRSTILSDAAIKVTEQKTIESDAKIKVFGQQKEITSDTFFSSAVRSKIKSDAHIKILDIEEDILSDSYIVMRSQKEITSDASIFATLQQNIESLSFIVVRVLIDFTNKFNLSKQVIKDISHKINTVKEIITDVHNIVRFVKSYIINIRNDIRTQKQNLTDVSHDIRFIRSWQIPGNAGFQSLGKTYIKIYINSIEQTDINIDSININKILSASHTAQFDLARPYDSTKPMLESLVEIKYNNWLLYKGYITEIRPASSPESMTITCQNKFWKDNRDIKYFYVGHEPANLQEGEGIYYETINQALINEYNWSLDIGNFVPEQISCFVIDKSDALTNLIRESGNYEWYYDENEVRNLWRAGEGSIVNIESQAIGTNLGLYQLISHKFTESSDNLVNQYRVQLGNKVIKGDGGHRWSGYWINWYTGGHCIPAWDSNYERFSKDTGKYGYDYPDPEHSGAYQDVFRKYYLPFLASETESWEDYRVPWVEIIGYNYTGILEYFFESFLGRNADNFKEGYSINYQDKIITFNDPVCVRTSDGRMYRVGINIHLWKRKAVPGFVIPPSGDEEIKLTFDTDKMGDYSSTIKKELALSNLDIQIGGGLGSDENGNSIIIPSWDDTNYARDFANFQLSKTCDKKINGTIELTLDAVCFYNLDLSKRIYINGITESPMNIVGIDYNISNFTVTLTLENSRSYKRTVSYIYHGV